MFSLIALLAPAHALSCLWGVHDANIAEGQSVPANVEITVFHTYAEGTELDVVVEDAMGAEVATTIDVQEGWAVLVPEAELPPGSYALRDRSPEGYLDVGFQVTGDLDTTPPGSPLVVSIEREYDRTEWGTAKGLLVELAATRDEPVIYEWELGEDGDFSAPLRYVGGSTSVLLGHGLCDSTVAAYDHRRRYDVRVRAIDVAGNVSEWTEPAAARGCSSLASAPGALAFFLVPLLLGRRRSQAV